MLVSGRDVYVNGERLAAPRGAAKPLASLAHARELAPGSGAGSQLAAVLYSWYEAGYIGLARS